MFGNRIIHVSEDKKGKKIFSRMWYREMERWKILNRDTEGLGERSNLMLIKIPEGKHTNGVLSISFLSPESKQLKGGLSPDRWSCLSSYYRLDRHVQVYRQKNH